MEGATGRRTPLPSSAWRLTVSLCVVSSADWYLQLVLFWLAASRGWSGAALAGIVVAARAPTFLGGVLGGRMVDRVGARRMFLVDAGARGAVLALLTATAVLHRDSFPVIAAGAACCALFTPLSYAAARTLMPRLVEDRQLGRANAALSLSDQLSLTVAGLLAGPVLLWYPPAAFAVPALLLAVGYVLAARLPDLPDLAASPPAQGAAGPALRRRVPSSVVAMICLSTIYFLVYGPFQPLMPALVRGHLHGDAGSYSAIRVSIGLGALLGLLLAPRLSAMRRPGVVNALGAVAYGLILFPLVLVHSMPPALLIVFVSGIAWGPYAAVEATALQRWAAPEQHGRVFGTQRALTISAIPIGGAVASLASDHLAVTTILGASALACSVTGLVGLLVPSLRRIASPRGDLLDGRPLETVGDSHIVA